jgi:methionyl aminopeptidase
MKLFGLFRSKVATSEPARPAQQPVQNAAVPEPSERTPVRSIKLHGPGDFASMRRAGRLCAETLDFITPHVRPGVTTAELDRLCHDFIVENGGVPATLGYRGYPASICVALNHVACHGVPGPRNLDNGDSISIDLAVILDGWHGCSSRTFLVGDTKALPRRLCDVAYEGLVRGIGAVKPGAHLGDIGHAIQSYVESNRFSIVRDYCGFGTGRIFHDAPNVLNYGKPGTGPQLREGMFIAIQPMVNAGGWQVKILSDGWTAVTKDRSLSAQFKHTIGVTASGAEIFTLSPRGLTKPPYDSRGPTG